jgi:hypothetical protein
MPRLSPAGLWTGKPEAWERFLAREMQELTMPPAKQLTAPGSSPGRASGPVSVGMSDLELGYPVCAGAGAECTLSGSAGDFGPDGPVVVFLLCYPPLILNCWPSGGRSMALQSRPPMLHENRKSQIAQLMRESRGPAVRAPAPGPRRMIDEVETAGTRARIWR